MSEKLSNPKDIIGCDKLPIHLWPSTATAMGCIGLLNGALKYGRNNFRAVGVRASIYVDAAKRHIDAWMEGEEVDSDDGVPHLAAALACLAIIVDARAAGNLNDDRNFKGDGYRKLVEELTPHVARLKAHHAVKSPKHYTIADSLAKAVSVTIEPSVAPSPNALRTCNADIWPVGAKCRYARSERMADPMCSGCALRARP